MKIYPEISEDSGYPNGGGTMDGMPTIKIDLEIARSGMIRAFSDHMEEIKQYTSSAIDAAMTSLLQGGLEDAIIQTTERALRDALYQGLKSAVRDAVTEYFETGEGQKFVSDAIVEYIKNKSKRGR